VADHLAGGEHCALVKPAAIATRIVNDSKSNRRRNNNTHNVNNKPAE